MQTELYCATLENLDRVKAVRALQMAHIKMKMAMTGDADDMDPRAALRALEECLADAGHIAFRHARTA